MEEGEEEVKKKGFETPKPVAVGDVVEVEITAVGGRGDGIAKIDSFVIFVKGGQKDEKCKVKIVSVGRTHATAEKVE